MGTVPSIYYKAQIPIRTNAYTAAPKNIIVGILVIVVIIVAREEAMAVILLTEPKRVTRVQSQK